MVQLQIKNSRPGTRVVRGTTLVTCTCSADRFIRCGKYFCCFPDLLSFNGESSDRVYSRHSRFQPVPRRPIHQVCRRRNFSFGKNFPPSGSLGPTQSGLLVPFIGQLSSLLNDISTASPGCQALFEKVYLEFA